jgi:hypothetical protein
MSFTIMLSRKALRAARPLALERPLLIMRPNVALEIERPRERAPAPGHGTAEPRLVLPPRRGSIVRRLRW